MPNTVYDFLSEGVKYVATGLLGVLWWDVRKVRLLEGTIMSNVKKMFLSPDGKPMYVTYEKHRDVCKINTLEQNKEMQEYIDSKFEDLKGFIKTNGG